MTAKQCILVYSNPLSKPVSMRAYPSSTATPVLRHPIHGPLCFCMLQLPELLPPQALTFLLIGLELTFSVSAMSDVPIGPIRPRPLSGLLYTIIPHQLPCV